MLLDFTKMNGAGNDFVVIDARNTSISLSPEQIRQLSSRDNAVTKGCDQLLILEPSTKSDVFMRIYNADGGEVDACGNATRCIADMLYKEMGRLPVTIQTNVAVLQGVREEISPAGHTHVLVDMGVPKFDWQDIPLSMQIEKATKKLIDFINLPELGAPTFVNMGNPHAVFFVDELPFDVEVARIGSKIENYTEVFPQRVNVSFVKRMIEISVQNNQIQVRVWERGAGLTKACGTGACAILAAANKLDSSVKNAFVWFENSMQSVSVSLETNGHILLGGAVETEFSGTVEI